MTGRAPPALTTVRIRRLSLPAGEGASGLGAQIAASLQNEFGAADAGASRPGLAREIARGIAGHPHLAAAGVAPRRSPDGER